MIDFVKHNFWNILIVLNYVVAISAAITILLKNINPTKTISYIMVLVFFPFLGLLVYYFFGQEYRKNKIFNRKHILNKRVVKNINKELQLNNKEKREIKQTLDEKVKLVKLLYNSEQSPLTLNNKVKLIKNGEEKFKLLLKDLEQAQSHIHMEYYILKDDKIGTQVLDVLCEKAIEGVNVRLTFDDVGSKLSKAIKKKLKESGIEYAPFMPVLFPKFTGKMNYRNHRKIVVIDGRIGYLGGINISDTYVNYETDNSYWRDTHLRIEGEAVKPLQINFLTTWNFVSNTDLSISKAFFPEIEVTEEVPVQIAASGPDTDWANIMETIFTAIVTAQKYVYITTPYFIPNDEVITAMQVAAKSGVEVKLLIPKHSDSWTAEHATNSYLESLLEAGVEIYRYKKGFVHAKTLVVDDIFCTVGTSNMDYRSFNINFEINALIYDETQSKALKKFFNDDIKDSEQLTLQNWQKRSRLSRLKESFCRLWAPLL